jgi:hypothetical protein
MTVGAAVGVGASVWAQRKLKVAAARYRPSGVAGSAAARARTWPAHVRAALDEGRTTMRTREAELRRGMQGTPQPEAGRWG